MSEDDRSSPRHLRRQAGGVRVNHGLAALGPGVVDHLEEALVEQRLARQVELDQGAILADIIDDALEQIERHLRRPRREPARLRTHDALEIALPRDIDPVDGRQGGDVVVHQFRDVVP